MKIGLMGGTFDPPHIGHLLIAEQAQEQLELDGVWFVPANVPPHKQRTVTDATKRLRLVEEAIALNPAFSVSAIEFEREEPSYTYDTIRALKHRYPEHEFLFLIGADSLVSLDTWYQAEQLYEEVVFGAVARPGSRYLIPRGAHVKAVDMPLLEISSTDIRQRVACGRSIRYLVPEAVRQRIEEWNLYAP